MDWSDEISVSEDEIITTPIVYIDKLNEIDENEISIGSVKYSPNIGGEVRQVLRNGVPLEIFFGDIEITRIANDNQMSVLVSSERREILNNFVFITMDKKTEVNNLRELSWMRDECFYIKVRLQVNKDNTNKTIIYKVRGNETVRYRERNVNEYRNMKFKGHLLVEVEIYENERANNSYINLIATEIVITEKIETETVRGSKIVTMLKGVDTSDLW
eukprot:TRINITY_DN1_c0_g1_i1.p1 TRINITY_DN1_c0_g1~~TRINITY_DN1_c0_g1_i1.p1  ORF type:complete len:216 (+),score=36.11 TRINITY_DN1_c0_g1_i1:26-673(+)